MRHEHECKICHKRFECAVISHCSLDSYHKDVNERPICPQCLQGLSEIEVVHSGKRYVFNTDNRTEAELEFDGDFYTKERELIYAYNLKGRHEGEPIPIYMVNPNWESDEDGIAYVWNRLVYADNHEQIDDVIDDFYSDALREDLKITINETWD